MKNIKLNEVIILFIAALAFWVIIHFSACQVAEPYGDYVWTGFPPKPQDTVINTIDTIPQDTIFTDTIIPLPVIVDTCETYIHLSDTNFVVLSAAFDEPLHLVGFRWFDQWADPTIYLDLATLIDIHFPGYQLTYYQSDHAIAMLIDGTNNHTQFQGRIKVVSNNPGTLLTGYKNALYTWDALTLDEAMYEANHRLNIESFANTGQDSWTQDRRDAWARSVCKFSDCKHGERRADYRYAFVSQSIIDSTILYQWTNVYQ